MERKLAPVISAKSNKLICSILAILMALALCSCGSIQGVASVSGKNVVSVGGYKFTQAEYDYFYYNYIDNDGCTEEEAKQGAEQDLRHYAAVLSLANRYGVELSDQDIATAKEALQSGIDYYGEEDFDAQLASYHMNREIYLRLTELQALETNLRSYMIDETSIEEDGNPIIDSSDIIVKGDIPANFYFTKQIFIKNDEGDDIEENRALAQDIYQRLQDGADFDELIAEYSEDDEKGVRFFTDGMMVEEFEQATKSIDPGKMSRVVESSVGFHIILRVTLDDDYINDNFEDIRFAFQNRVFNSILSGCADNLELVWKK